MTKIPHLRILFQQKIGAVFLFAAESEAQFDYLALPSELMCEV